MSIVFCREFSEAILIRLESLIVQHHCKFKELFPDCRLIPKHHFMCHYPFVVRQSGPLISLWTMRFEGKHNYFAQLANNTKNFKNICHTLAWRHQQYSAVAFKKFSTQIALKADNIFLQKLYQFSNSFDVIELLRNSDQFRDCNVDTEICTTNQIWFKNYNYKLNFVVCFGHESIFPKFGIISEFLLTNESTCYLLLRQLNVEYFDRHFFSYRVNNIGEVCISFMRCK